MFHELSNKVTCLANTDLTFYDKQYICIHFRVETEDILELLGSFFQHTRTYQIKAFAAVDCNMLQKLLPALSLVVSFLALQAQACAHVGDSCNNYGDKACGCVDTTLLVCLSPSIENTLDRSISTRPSLALMPARE